MSAEGKKKQNSMVLVVLQSCRIIEEKKDGKRKRILSDDLHRISEE